jgi:hypothetical protein
MGTLKENGGIAMQFAGKTETTQPRADAGAKHLEPLA